MLLLAESRDRGERQALGQMRQISLKPFWFRSKAVLEFLQNHDETRQRLYLYNYLPIECLIGKVAEWLRRASQVLKTYNLDCIWLL